MAAKRVPDPKKRFTGIWKCCDGFSDVEISVKVRANAFRVSALDRYDGEVPEVYDVNWNEERAELSFAIHWSSGRFLKYRFMPSVVKDRLELTYTFIAQELWQRV